MFKDTKFLTTYLEAPNHTLFDVKTNKIKLGPAFISSFELPIELENFLDSDNFEMDFSLPATSLYTCTAVTHNLKMLPKQIDIPVLSFQSNDFEMDFSLPTSELKTCVAVTHKLKILPEQFDLPVLSFQSNDFKMDFSLPTSEMKTCVAVTHKLKILPEQFDFSELSFHSVQNDNSKEQLPLEQQEDVCEGQNESGVYFLADMDQDYVKSQEFAAPDNTELQPELHPCSGILSDLVRNRYLSTERIKSFASDDKRNEIKQEAHDKINRIRLPYNFTKTVQPDLAPILSGASRWYKNMKLPSICQNFNKWQSPKYEETNYCCQSFEGLGQDGGTLGNKTASFDSVTEKSIINFNAPVYYHSTDNNELIDKGNMLSEAEDLEFLELALTKFKDAIQNKKSKEISDT